MAAVEQFIGAILKETVICTGCWFNKSATSPNLWSQKVTNHVSILPTWQNIILDSRYRMKLIMSSCCAKEVLKGEKN
jgi:hypothetical protein